MNEDRISQQIGDGGAATDRFINEEIISRFGNPILAPLEDGSHLTLGSQDIIVTTDSFIVNPIFFPQSDIGALAIAGTVNDIVASGGMPRFITLSLIISEGLAVLSLRKILDSAKKVADQAGIQVIAGDTKTLFADHRHPSIFINTTGIGVPIVSSEYKFSLSEAKPGDLIIVTGPIGNHGLAVLSAREGLGFEHRVFSDCNPLNGLICPLVEHFHSDIHCLRDPSRGGLTGVLVDIAKSAGVDIEIDYAKIPIQKEVAFGCEMLGIDPMELVNEGKMAIVVKASSATKVVDFLRDHPLGTESAIIGKVKKRKTTDGMVIMKKGIKKISLFKKESAAIPRLC